MCIRDRRVARLGDGWLPMFRTPAAAAGHLDTLDRYLAEHGRTRADVGIEARLHWGDGDLDALGRALEEWRAAGATHVSLNTMGVGFKTADEHLMAIHRIANAFMIDG